MTVAKVYGPALGHLIDLQDLWVTGGLVVCALLDNTYTPNQDGHEFEADLTGELTDVSYARVTCTGTGGTTPMTVSYDAGTNTLTVDCDDISWTALTSANVRYAVFFDTNNADPATNPLLCYMDFEADQTFTAQDLTLVIPATGLLSITTSA